MIDFKNLQYNRFLFFDGAMGTMLQGEGLKAGMLPEAYNILNSELIVNIHKKYLKAGADIITTNTFGANNLKLVGTEFSLEEIVHSAVTLAKRAIMENGEVDKYVALDISSLGELIEPMGEMSFEKAYELFSQIVICGSKAGADLILIETISDIYEAKAAILAAKENSNLPVFVTMTFQSNGRTLTGTDPETMVTILESLGVDAYGVNCSLGPKELLPIVKQILTYSHKPIIVQPNAGLPRDICGKVNYDVTSSDFAYAVEEMAKEGALIFGGCCGTNPSYIEAMVLRLKDKNPIHKNNNYKTTVSSYSNTLIIGEEVAIIGERINPTGKKLLKEALKNNDLEYIVSEAIDQKEAGADILDINVGLPGIDEKDMMVRVVKEVQGYVKLPLQIDSSNTDAIEAAVRVCTGKPIINSVNGNKSIMGKVFPIAAKYGACIVGLTLDENGIPSSAEGRYQIAKKIVETAESYGIHRSHILIDCLVLTASAQQEEVMETIKAIRLVKEGLGVKTILGVSNVSFGLPDRGLLNRTFLSMALGAGLDAPILNPMDKEMMATIGAFNVLSGVDKESQKFIRNASLAKPVAASSNNKETKSLRDVILSGTVEEATILTTELLKVKSSMEIVDEYFVPALDEAGKSYERGDTFLPQLLKTAEIVKASFDILKANMKETEKSISKGKIIIATVKGDIHDIGKNIVKVLLENYGFDVIDLGKDVAPELILDTIRSNNVKLIGLSALMTTTVKNMEDTIIMIKESYPDCTVIVGGAVLNTNYAKKIGADYYAKDANEAVKIVKSYYQA
ncbi:MAG TPA: homocysteine S-methyltransferase family protein [Clostridiaceae bacterium]